MQTIKMVTLMFFISLLSACVSAPKAPSEVSQATEPSRLDFKRIDYVELQEDELRFNKALLAYEHTHDASDLSHSLNAAFERSPKIAKYMVDNNLIRADINYAFYLNEKALRTLVQSGQFDPYLNQYWNKVIHQTDTNWFKVDFATQASVFAANNHQHAPSQRNLALYSMHACPTYDLVRSGTITGTRPQDEMLFGLLDKCKAYPNEAAKWAGQYLANKNVSMDDKNVLLYQMADFYFSRKDYAHAASYYKLVIDFEKKNIKDEELTQLVDLLVLKTHLGAGLPINQYLREIQQDIKTRKYINETAIKRLNLILNAGVLNFSDYGL